MQVHSIRVSALVVMVEKFILCTPLHLQVKITSEAEMTS